MIISQYKQQNSTIWINLIAHHFFNNRYIDICKCLYDLGTVIFKLIQLTIISLQFLGEQAQVKLPIRLIISGSGAPLVECTAPIPSSSPGTLLFLLMLVDIQVLLCPPEPTLPSGRFAAISLLPLLMTRTSSVLSWFPPGHPRRSRAADANFGRNAFLTRMEVVYYTSTQEILALSQ